MGKLINGNYFLSKNVKVFPTAYRGDYAITSGQFAGQSYMFDPESRLNTEFNLTHLPGLGYNNTSYIVEYDATELILKCVIGGYYFEIYNFALSDLVSTVYNSSTNTDDLVVKKLYIHTTEVDLKADTDSTTGADDVDRARKTTILQSWYGNVLDQQLAETETSSDDDETDTYAFTGIYCSSSEPTGQTGFLSVVKIVNETPILDAESLLPAALYHGDGDASLRMSLTNKAYGDYSIALGEHTEAGNADDEDAKYSIALGSETKSSGFASIAAGTGTEANGSNAFAIGEDTHAGGSEPPYGINSFAIGKNTTASGNQSVAAGQDTEASNINTHAEGYCTHATAPNAHAEGKYTEANGEASHAEGIGTAEVHVIASKDGAHAEGKMTEASGLHSHAEGYRAVASVEGAHAAGKNTLAKNKYSYAGGNYTVTDAPFQTVIGKYNKLAAGELVIGIGTAKNDQEPLREDARLVNAVVVNGTDTTINDTLNIIDFDSNNEQYTVAKVSSGETILNSDSLTENIAGDININLPAGKLLLKTAGGVEKFSIAQFKTEIKNNNLELSAPSTITGKISGNDKFVVNNTTTTVNNTTIKLNGDAIVNNSLQVKENIDTDAGISGTWRYTKVSTVPTSKSDYIGYYIYKNGEYLLVTDTNYETLVPAALNIARYNRIYNEITGDLVLGSDLTVANDLTVSGAETVTGKLVAKNTENYFGQYLKKYNADLDKAPVILNAADNASITLGNYSDTANNIFTKSVLVGAGSTGKMSGVNNKKLYLSGEGGIEFQVYNETEEDNRKITIDTDGNLNVIEGNICGTLKLNCNNNSTDNMLFGICGTNGDAFRLRIAANNTGTGSVEFATTHDGNEPIAFKQYKGSGSEFTQVSTDGGWTHEFIALNNDGQTVAHQLIADEERLYGSLTVRKNSASSASSVSISEDGGIIAACGTSKKVSINSGSNGDIVATGEIQAQTFYATSDRRLKENFVEFTPDKSVLELPVYRYNFIGDDTPHIGCIAQDLQEICPEIVYKNENGYLSIEESKLVYLLLDEVKKLKAEVEELKK